MEASPHSFLCHTVPSSLGKRGSEGARQSSSKLWAPGTAGLVLRGDDPGRGTLWPARPRVGLELCLQRSEQQRPARHDCCDLRSAENGAPRANSESGSRPPGKPLPSLPTAQGKGLALEMLIPAPQVRRIGRLPPTPRGTLACGIRQLLLWCPSLCKQGPPHVPHWAHERVEATEHRVSCRPGPRQPLEEVGGQSGTHTGATAASLQHTGPQHEPGNSPGSRPCVLPRGPRVSSTRRLPSAPRGLSSRTACSWIRAAFSELCISSV